MKTRSKATQILRAMLARRYGFGASPNKQRPGLCGHGGIACHLATPSKMAQKTEVTPSYAPSVSRACLSPSAVALITISSFSSIELSMTSICFRQLLSPLSSSGKKN
mgnify:FL=1